MSALEDRRARLRVGKAAAYRRRRFVVLGVLVSLVLGIAGFGLYRFWNKPLSTALPAPVTVDAKQFTMLVMGSDDRPGEPGRSDTMMVGFVDLAQGSVKLLSIPRDSYVQIPGHGWDKINAAYPFGGVALVQQTVEQLIGMKMNYTMSVNMQGFEQIVDAVGGVDINIPQDMDYEDPYDKPVPLVIHLKKGLQHLNGVDALHFVRFRHDAESDWGRMKRQQQFLQALTQAALKPANLTSLPDLVKLGSQNVTTNLSLSQLTQLAMLGRDKLGADRISGGTLQGDDIWATDGYYLGLHFADMRAKVRELAGLTADDKQIAQDSRDAQAYQAELPGGSSLPGGQTSDSGSGGSGASPVSAPAGNSGTKPPSGTTAPGHSGTETRPPSGGVTPAPGGTQGGGSSGSKSDSSPAPTPGRSNSGSSTPAPGTGGSGGSGSGGSGSGSGSGGSSPAPGAGNGGGSKSNPAPPSAPAPNPTPPPAPGGSGKSGSGSGTGAKPPAPGTGGGGTSSTTPAAGGGSTSSGT